MSPQPIVPGDDRTELDSVEAPGPVAGMPSHIGPFRVLSLLGRGGMGEVWLGERDDGQFQQRVAIKLSLRGRGEELLRRMLSERRILASLQHPRIARLLDGGTTDDGRPYLVMEYVDGQSLDEWLQTGPSLALRLDLFCKICEAVQYAHQQLVVHRDLKPANIIVDRQGEPHLLDFGIARLLEDADGEDLRITRTGASIMTPAYASPEQVSGAPVGTASDVYMLGLILYEMLAGARAHDLSSSSRPAQFEAMICHTQPLRPSQRLSDRKSRQALLGDLDNIVMMALRKEPQRRYASAAAFAEDIQRHRERRPVRAHPDSLGYQLTRFVQRHRYAVLVAVLILAGLVAALQREFVLRGAAEAARQQAELESRRAMALAEFMGETFAAADPGSGAGRDTTVLEALETALPRAERYLDSDPATYAEVLNAVTRLKMSYSRYSDVEADLRLSLESLADRLPATHPQVLSMVDQIADAIAYQARYDESATWFDRAYRVRAESLGEDAIATLVARSRRSDIQSAMGNHEHALAEQQHCQQRLLEVAGEIAPETMDSLRLLVGQYMGAGRLREALEWMGVQRDRLLRLHGADASSLEPLAYRECYLRWSLDGPVSAWPHCARSLELAEQHAGADSLRLANPLNLRALLWLDMGYAEQALQDMRRAIEIATRAGGSTLGVVMLSQFNAARAHGDLGQIPQALELAKIALQGMQQTYGAVHSRTERSRLLIESLQMQLEGRYEPSRFVYTVADHGVDEDSPRASWHTSQKQLLEAEAAFRAGLYERTRELCSEAIARLHKQPSEDRSIERDIQRLHWQAILAMGGETDTPELLAIRDEAYPPSWGVWLPSPVPGRYRLAEPPVVP